MRLIDADALMYAVDGNPLTTDSLKEYVRSTVKAQPTIDSVPVIRCKDCKHLRIVNRQELAAMCSFHCYKFEPFADDYRECFCSWAERKEE